MITRNELHNGAVILTETVPQTRTVSIGFWFLHGSRDEADGEFGMSHFLEHMLFKGTVSYTPLQIVQQIDRVGGVLNAFTEKEQTCFYCTLPAEHVGIAIRLLAEMAFTSTLPKVEIAKEKQVILNEIAEIEDMPEELAYELFLSNTWGDHPLARRITGNPESIQGLNRNKLLTFYEKWFVPSNLIVSVAGKIDSEAVIREIEKVIPDGRPACPEKNRSHPRQLPSREYRSSHFQQTHLLLGTSFPIPENIPDFYIVLVFSTLFGEFMSSRLFQSVREQAGLCYSVQAMRTFFSSTVLWNVYANTSIDLLNKLIKAMNIEFHRLKMHPPSDSEVNDAISHLSGGLILSLEDMEYRMKRMVRHSLLGGIIHEMEESIRLLQAVTTDSVHRFINTRINNENFNLLVFGTKDLDTKRKIKFQF